MIKRFFRVSARVQMPRQSQLAVQRFVPPTLHKITGDIDKDGLHRFEVDWLETAEWTKNLLESMRDDVAILQTIAEKAREQAKTAISKDQEPRVVCVKETKNFSYDFSKKPQERGETSVMLKVSSILEGIKGKDAKDLVRHRLVLLAGDLYDPRLDVITLSRNWHEHDKIDLLEMMENLVKLAQDTTKEQWLNSVPAYQTAQKNLEFPEKWITQGKTLSSMDKASLQSIEQTRERENKETSIANEATST